MKTPSPKKRDFVAWAKSHPVPETSVLAWGAGVEPSSESVTVARVLLGPSEEGRVRTVAEHLDALIELTGASAKPRRRADG